MLCDGIFSPLRFPFSDKDRLQQWIHNIKRKDWTPNQHSRLCSQHFQQDCFIHVGSRVYLTRIAVPTIFYPHCPLPYRVPCTRVSQITKVREASVVPQAPSLTVVTHDHDYMSYTHGADPTIIQMDEASSSQASDHAVYSLKNSPRHLRRKLSLVQNTLVSNKKKLKLQRLRARRLERKVKSLSAIITDLKEKLLVSATCGDMLEASLQGVAKEILIRTKYRNKSARVSDDLKSFAMTLHFYSAKAYQFVRESFDCVLPHPQTIRSWCSSTPADPGITEASFSGPQAHVEEGRKEGKETTVF